jgi:hypothetical protein
VLFGQPPGAEGKENGKDHREFLGDHRHGEGDARKDALDQAGGKGMVGDVEPGDDPDQDEEHPGNDGAGADQTPRLLLQGVGSSGAPATWAPIFPNSVEEPVFSTRTVPLPLVTRVPA